MIIDLSNTGLDGKLVGSVIGLYAYTGNECIYFFFWKNKKEKITVSSYCNSKVQNPFVNLANVEK